MVIYVINQLQSQEDWNKQNSSEVRRFTCSVCSVLGRWPPLWLFLQAWPAWSVWALSFYISNVLYLNTDCSTVRSLVSGPCDWLLLRLICPATPLPLELVWNASVNQWEAGWDPTQSGEVIWGAVRLAWVCPTGLRLKAEKCYGGLDTPERWNSFLKIFNVPEAC